MFVESNHFRRDSKIIFHDKSSRKVLSTERAVIPFLKWFDTPDGELAYKFLKMSNTKNFVTNNTVCVRVTPAQQKLLQLITPVEAQDFYKSLKNVHYLGTYCVENSMVELCKAGYVHQLLDAIQAISQEHFINNLKSA